MPCPRCNSNRTRLFMRSGERVKKNDKMYIATRNGRADGDVYVCMDCWYRWSVRRFVYERHT